MEPPDDAVTLWRRTVEALVAKGATPAEAIDGANLIVAALRRQQDQELERQREQGPSSGERRAG